MVANQEFIPKSQRTKFNQALKSSAVIFSGSFVLGGALNVFVKKIVPNFFELPTIHRVGARSVLFALPLLVGSIFAQSSFKTII